MLNDFFKATDKAQPQPARFAYIVYACTETTFGGFRIKSAVDDRTVHNTIAQRENNHPSRTYAGIVRPGSFNFARVAAAADLTDAVAQARAAGLRHEPIRTVLSRFVMTEQASAERVKVDNKGNAGIEAEVRAFQSMLDKFKKGQGFSF